MAAAYLRVSTEDQVEYSLDSQLKLIREYAKKNNFIVPDDFVFVDDGISGRTTQKRFAFNKMIGIAKTKPKPFDVILLWKFSRFARNREDSIVYKSMLRKQLGIEVVSISESLGDDKLSILIEAMIEAMDEYYSINLAEEVKRGMTEKFSRGEVVTPPAFGYDVKDGVYVPNQEQTIIVNEIFQLYLSGAGCREIAIILNERGVKTKRGNKWENRTIDYILLNPVYIGKMRRLIEGAKKDRRYEDIENVNIVSGQHEPIITMELWNAVQEKWAEHRKVWPRFKRDSCKMMFTLYGLVKCDNCGSNLSMSRNSTSNLLGLQCVRYAKGQCTESHYITLSKIEAFVMDALENDFNDKNFKLDFAQSPITAKDTNVIQSLNKQVQKEKAKLVRIKEAYAAGIDTIEEYRSQKLEIQAIIEKIEKKILPIQSSNILDPEKAKSEFIKKVEPCMSILRNPSSSVESKNAALKSFVERINFSRKNNSVQIFYKL